MAGHAPLLSATGVSKTFPGKHGPVQALDAVSLTVRPGGMTALVGPDGAGKTTLLRIVAGLLRPDSGEITFAGRSLAEARAELQEDIAYMPQKFGLYEDLTVRENLDLYADLKGLPPAEREARYGQLLRMCALEPFQARLAGKLSGGMKQKLGLICTLVKPPRLLLLDEPTVGVDPLSRRELWEIVSRLTGQARMAVLLSTSYLDEAARCAEVVLLFEGETLARDTPRAIEAKADGRAYLAAPAPQDSPRALQARLLDGPGVIDAAPRGGEVRFVRGGQPDETPPAALERLLGGAVLRRSPPDLEDGFMLLLRERLDRRAGPGQAGPQAVQAPIRPAAPATDGEAVIKTEHVFRYFGDFAAVHDVSFTVRRGEVFGLLGPNGAGKTTTFRMLCGLLPASRGNLFVAGVNVRAAREEARRHLGYVAQKFSLYGPLSVRENLEFFAGAYGIRGAARNRRIREVAADFALEKYLDLPAGDLPGGYKQRLSMAVGLLHQPAILFLDEPTSGADPLARRAFWKRISGLAGQGVTIVVTTHFMEEAEYCDRVLIQDKGRMLALDTPANIRARAGQAHGPNASMEDAFIEIVAQARGRAAEPPGRGQGDSRHGR